MQKPTIFVTRRWPKKTVEEMKKFFEVRQTQKKCENVEKLECRKREKEFER